jgi:LAO/AO transport system kinase
MDKKIKDLIQNLKSGKRLALAQIITLLESERIEDQLTIDQVVDELTMIASTKKTFRLGLTGSPGAGKSSLIEKIGMNFIKRGLKVAVLAIDPSSEMTRGSVLGDKTRMEELSAQEEAFIRPSPSRGHLGGVSVATHDAIKACEVAGYDLIIIETVGVGQSESQVADLVDMYTLVALPGAGDELQGIKRGLLEKVDNVIVNKFDGETKVAAQIAEKQLKSSLSILRGQDIPIFLTSAIYENGIQEFCESVGLFWKTQSEAIKIKRQSQEQRWVAHYIDQFLRREVDQIMESNKGLAAGLEMVKKGVRGSRDVAREFIVNLLK